MNTKKAGRQKLFLPFSFIVQQKLPYLIDFHLILQINILT